MVQSAANNLNSDLRVSEHLSVCLLNDGRTRLTLPAGEIPQLLNADPAVLFTQAQCDDPTLDRNVIEFEDYEEYQEVYNPIEEVEENVEEQEKPKKNGESMMFGSVLILILTNFVIRFHS